MAKTLLLLGFLVLAGCSNAPTRSQATSAACAGGEASSACQVQRYHDAPG